MQLHRPDPDYATSLRSRRNFILAARLAVMFVALVWIVFILDYFLQLNLVRFGLFPRRAEGLIGILTTPFLHGNWSHLISNTLPLLVAGTAILFLYPNSALRVIPLIYLGTPLLAWTFARPDLHVGASGFIYGLLTYVFFGGLWRRDVRSIGVSLLVYFLYGSMVYGVLPGQGRTSWELHLSGAMLGLVLAWLYRRWDLPPRKRYDWEDEEHEEEALPWRQDDEDRH